MTVIGNGMLSTAFGKLAQQDQGILVFASGVSDSSCTDGARFDREQTLLLESLKTHVAASRFIYFGTCSAYDPDAVGTPYVVHKKQMEAHTLGHARPLVVRLPQIAGPGAPPNTLLSALVRKIRNGDQILVWGNATRNILDVEDAVRIVSIILRRWPPSKRIINVANPRSAPVLEIVRAIENVMGVSANIKIIDKGASYSIDTTELTDLYHELGMHFSPDYLERVVAKYYK